MKIEDVNASGSVLTKELILQIKNRLGGKITCMHSSPAQICSYEMIRLNSLSVSYGEDINKMILQSIEVGEILRDEKMKSDTAIFVGESNEIKLTELAVPSLFLFNVYGGPKNASA